MRGLVVCALLVACGDNIYVMQPEELAMAYRDAVCRHWIACGVVRDMHDCTRIYSYRVHPDVTAALEAGVVRWDGEAAMRCIDWFDRATCDPTDAMHREPACFGVYLGTKHDGEPCAWGTECISRECWKESTTCTDACCIGYCTGDTPPTIGRIGDRCRYSPCAEGYCEDSLCVAWHEEGMSCDLNEQCAPGLACAYATTPNMSGTCEPLPAEGEACTGRCRDIGQECHPYTRRCVPAALQGDRCLEADVCSALYECSYASYTCEARGLGESCFVTRCALPYVCDLKTGKCVQPKADGAPCFASYECASGSCSQLGMCTSDVCI